MFPLPAASTTTDALVTKKGAETTSQAQLSAPKTPLLYSPLINTPGTLRKIQENKEKQLAAQKQVKPDLESRKSF